MTGTWETFFDWIERAWLTYLARMRRVVFNVTLAVVVTACVIIYQYRLDRFIIMVTAFVSVHVLLERLGIH